MDEEQKIIINQWKEIFKLYLNPLAIMDELTGLFVMGSPEFANVYVKKNNPHEAVECLISTLVDSNRNFFNEFLEAVKKHHGWLGPLVNGKLDPADCEEAIGKIENQNRVREFLTLILPRMDKVDAKDVSYRLHCKHVIDQGEKEFIHAEIQNNGNIAAARTMLQILVRKEPKWLVEFVKILRKLKYDLELVELLEDVRHNIYSSSMEKVKTIEDNINEEGEASNTANPLYHHQLRNERQQRIPDLRDPDRVGGTSLRLRRSTDSHTMAVPDSAGHTPTSDYGRNVGMQPTNGVTGATASHQVGARNLLLLDDEIPYDRPARSPTTMPTGAVSLREYQKALSVQAIRGENVIICAPTGSGKTRVVAHVIQTRFGPVLAQKDPKIAFLVPRVPLAKQQRDMIKSYLISDDWVVDYVVGGIKTTLKDAMLSSQVIVLTPQIMVDSLSDGSLQSLTQFDMLIFDECHHTMKDAPYNIIMQQYLRLKYDKDAIREGLPQIIGATASLGVGKGKREGDAFEHQMALCANLDALGGIVTVPMEHQDELNRYTPQAEEHNIMLEGAINDPFTLCLCETIDKIVSILYSMDLRKLKDLQRPNPLSKGSQQYVQWCQQLTQKAVQFSTDPELSRNIQLCSFYIRVFNEALDLHFKCRAVDALHFLQDRLRQSYEKNLNRTENQLYVVFRQCEAELQDCYKNPQCTNDNLLKMEEEILKTFESDRNSRAMLNVLKRQYTRPLQDWLNQSERLRHLELNAECFTGVGKNRDGSSSRLTHNKQENILEMFRDGHTKIIVCTPEVASEGLDIVDCNLVLCYDYVKNEISKTQVKGRARKQGGRMVQLSSRAVMVNDKVSITKTLLMENTTKAIQKMCLHDKQNYQQQLKKKQDEVILSARLQQMHSDKKRSKPKSRSKFRVMCRICSAFACYSTDIEVLNQTMYTCNSADFQQKYLKRVVPHGGTEQKEGLFCKHCDLRWGIFFKFKHIIIPLLKPDSFQFVDDRDPSSTPILGNQWEKIEISFSQVGYEELVKKLMGRL